MQHIQPAGPVRCFSVSAGICTACACSHQGLYGSEGTAASPASCASSRSRVPTSNTSRCCPTGAHTPISLYSEGISLRPDMPQALTTVAVAIECYEGRYGSELRWPAAALAMRHQLVQPPQRQMLNSPAPEQAATPKSSRLTSGTTGAPSCCWRMHDSARCCRRSTVCGRRWGCSPSGPSATRAAPRPAGARL